jgi:DNA-binding NarL/FixJ family response regulator
MTGMSNKELARDLKLGEGTVKIHVAALFRNLGVKSRVARGCPRQQAERETALPDDLAGRDAATVNSR